MLHIMAIEKSKSIQKIWDRKNLVNMAWTGSCDCVSLGQERHTVLGDIFEQGLQMLLLRGCGLVQPGQHISDVPARAATICLKRGTNEGESHRSLTTATWKHGSMSFSQRTQKNPKNIRTVFVCLSE